MVVDPRMRRVELPAGAPFNPVQRAWLEGFIAGFVVPGPAATPVATPEPLPLTVVYASQTGTAESLAKKLAKAAKAKGRPAKAVDVETLDLESFAGFGDIAVVASTHGEGDPPDPALRFADLLKAATGMPLAGLRFAVLALGDSNYARFCGFGRWLDERIGELGGLRLFERVDCDVEVDEPFAVFRETLLGKLYAGNGTSSVPAAPTHAESNEGEDEDHDTSAKWTRNRPFPSRLLEVALLNRPGSDKETRHVVLSLAGSDIAYEPGDALGVIPTNDPALVDAVLEASGLSSDAPATIGETSMDLRTALSQRLSIGKLSQATLIKFQATAESAELARLIEPDNAEEREAWLWGREFIDLLVDYPGVAASADELVAMLPRLAPRLYSIASSQRAHPDEVHLTVAVVRYATWGRARGGVASTEIADRMAAGAELPVYLHPNTRFRLPTDPDRPVIMIGPGTGIAPFRAFLEERRETGATAKNWLFFGDRRAACDYLYREELRAFGKAGLLTRIDTAFSRDQIDKIYVQHLMLEAGAEMWKWIADGAHIYVCGDGSRMARDVDDALVAIVAEHGRMSSAKARLELQQLAADRRYCRDVY